MRILIVDDSKVNRLVLSDFVKGMGHTPIMAENGAEALASITADPPDLVVLDIVMPVMTGEETLQKLKGNETTRQLPVIMISALDGLERVAACIQQGADDYLTKPFNPTLLRARISSCLEKKELLDQQARYQAQLEDYNRTLEERVQKQVEEISLAQLATIFAMSKLAESRDDQTGKHLERIREYCRVLSEKMQTMHDFRDQIGRAFVINIYAASPLHDIGKVGIPDNILLKPSRLSREEFDIMKMHASVGARTLRAVEKLHPRNSFVRMGVDVALSHHEKWNGAGYPNRLAGESIPLAGRVVALADVFDALTSERCYKTPFSFEKTCSIILEGRGTHFQPEIVDAFLDVQDEFLEISQLLKDASTPGNNNDEEVLRNARSAG